MPEQVTRANQPVVYGQGTASISFLLRQRLAQADPLLRCLLSLSCSQIQLASIQHRSLLMGIWVCEIDNARATLMPTAFTRTSWQNAFT